MPTPVVSPAPVYYNWVEEKPRLATYFDLGVWKGILLVDSKVASRGRGRGALFSFMTEKLLEKAKEVIRETKGREPTDKEAHALLDDMRILADIFLEDYLTKRRERIRKEVVEGV